MINTNFRIYNYFTYGNQDGYGQVQLSTSPVGSIKMSIFTSSQGIQDNVNYKDASYVGLTHAPIDDTYVIEYGDEKLKVLYVQPNGRYKQVFLKKI